MKPRDAASSTGADHGLELRVLHCLKKLDSGGPEVRRLSLARGLDRARYEQRILCGEKVGGLPARFEELGVKVTSVGAFRGLADRRPYARALAEIASFRPHIIHGAVFEGVLLATIAGRLGRVPIIVAEETSDPVNRGWRGNLLMRSLTALTHRVVAVSPAVRDYLRERIFLPAKKIALINNGVAEPAAPAPEAVAALREKLGLTAADFVIGTVGRVLDAHKRQSDLLRSLALLLRQHPRARLLIVGTGPDERMLRELARQLGVAEHVRFAGYQADPTTHYHVMDVFALASQWEAFGLVLVEAMFARLPVVATRVGGIPSIVDEARTGTLVPPRDPEALALAFAALSADPAARQRLGAAGLARARAHFSAERYVRDVDALYRELAAERLRQT